MIFPGVHNYDPPGLQNLGFGSIMASFRRWFVGGKDIYDYFY